MKQSIISFLAVYAVIAGATSCGPGSNAATVQLPAQYQQIERLARPAIKEATEPFARHDATNRSTPYAQPYSSQVLYQDIGSFVTTVGGRAAVNASTLQAILIPDEIAVDLSQSTTTAAYLGVDTGGATGSKYGGRALTDDVISIDLGTIFGKTLSSLGLIPDDGKSSPCLTTDNVPSQAVADHVATTFPYVGTPH
jgi:hypothetical protein